MLVDYYDDELITMLLKSTKVGDFEIKNNYFEAMDLNNNNKNNKYYVKGLDMQGVSSYVPSIYSFENGEKLVVSISQIYDNDNTDLIYATNIIIESVTNLKSEFKIFRFFCKYDYQTEKIKIDHSNVFLEEIINYLKCHILTLDVHMQIIIDFI